MAEHEFISMDWIQISGLPLCLVCSKALQTADSKSSPPAMCKNCHLQVHHACQPLAQASCSAKKPASGQSAPEPQTEAQSEQRAQVGGSDSAGASRDNIRLHRLTQSIKYNRKPQLATNLIIEGWLKTQTLADEQLRQYYWRLDDKDIKLYENDTSSRYFKVIALNNIKRVMSAKSLPKTVKEDVIIGKTMRVPGSEPMTRSANTSPIKSPDIQAQMRAIFAFELVTGSFYVVQAASESEACKWKEQLEAITETKRKEEAAAAEAGAGAEAHESGAAEAEARARVAADAASSEQQPADKPQQTSYVAGEEAAKKRAAHEQANTVNKLVESVNTVLLDTDKPPPSSARPSGPAAEGGPPATDGGLAGPATEANKRPSVDDGGGKASELGGQPSGTATSTGQAPRVVQQQRVLQPRGPQRMPCMEANRSRLAHRPRKLITLKPMAVPDHWIEGKYLIECDRATGRGFQELGSGQFGKVYAAISEIKLQDSSKGLWSGVPVAIKEISKARFDLRQQEKLKNEANILSRLDHPGVIILERVHDLPDKIYIVMEQLEDDMLEMIVSTEEKRLDERVTKFLTYQILQALRYLHNQHIAHCDLKPENVLLVERRSKFPQIKLCDFGFAKIIEDNSFRKSLVGTPAYLAPEVVKGERYNRTVDLWSVGVIVYVSLSGEFPFNEGENIHDQISRANFMYPDKPWARISSQAKNFISSLLRVNSDRRLSANRALMDEWIQDFQLWCDLSDLEVRVGQRWVTDEADYLRWLCYAKEHNLEIPRSAIQLHEQASADSDVN